MLDIANHFASSKITDLFIRSDFTYSHYTRFSAVAIFHVQGSSTNQQQLSFQELGQESGTKFILSHAS